MADLAVVGQGICATAGNDGFDTAAKMLDVGVPQAEAIMFGFDAAHRDKENFTYLIPELLDGLPKILLEAYKSYCATGDRLNFCKTYHLDMALMVRDAKNIGDLILANPNMLSQWQAADGDNRTMIRAKLVSGWEKQDLISIGSKECLFMMTPYMVQQYIDSIEK